MIGLGLSLEIFQPTSLAGTLIAYQLSKHKGPALIPETPTAHCVTLLTKLALYGDRVYTTINLPGI